MTRPKSSMSSSDQNLEDSDDYVEKSKKIRTNKRQKLKRSVHKQPVANAGSAFDFPIDELSEVLDNLDTSASFEDTLQPILPGLIQSRSVLELDQAEYDAEGKKLRPLRLHEATQIKERLADSSSSISALLRCKLQHRNRSKFNGILTDEVLGPEVHPLQAQDSSPDQEVLDNLYAIRTTPFHQSFLARLHGCERGTPNLISVDWETRTPWMCLLEDIREHYSLAYPEREQPVEKLGPLLYTTMHLNQQDQIHDLLERSFWPGIDVRDSLDYQPEKATVVAMYKKLVVGVAILKSPMETYIMYLAVKAGWDRSQIARTMLYHLISMNPGKDISLHVSTNNPAMLLYNQFGFKAEEFVAGFYAKYHDPRSTLSNNAFKLRLRHLPN